MRFFDIALPFLILGAFAEPAAVEQRQATSIRASATSAVKAATSSVGAIRTSAASASAASTASSAAKSSASEASSASSASATSSASGTSAAASSVTSASSVSVFTVTQGGATRVTSVIIFVTGVQPYRGAAGAVAPLPALALWAPVVGAVAVVLGAGAVMA